MAAVLATYQHHSAPRGPRTARTGEGARDELHGCAPEDAPSQAAGTQYFPMDVDDLPAAGGSRPDRLSEVRAAGAGPAAHRGTDHSPLPMLDVPVPLMEEQLLVDAFAPHDVRVPEQVIEVPMIFIDELSVRTPVREPQLAEQLVEVPTIHLLFLVAADCGAERGRSSSAMVVCAIFKVFPQDRLQRCLLSLWNAFLSGMWSRSLVFSGGGLQDFLPGQSSSSSSHDPARASDCSDAPGYGFFSHFSPRKKVRSAGQVSADLPWHVSSWTPPAYDVSYGP